MLQLWWYFFFKILVNGDVLCETWEVLTLKNPIDA